MSGFGDDGLDARQISQTPSSSGGSGGIFGNASAAIGDVGIGSSSAEGGRQTFDTNRYFNFAAPVVNKSNNNQLLIVGAFALGALFLFQRRGR